MVEKNKSIWITALSLLFVLGNCFLFTKDIYYLVALPFALLLVYFYFFSLDKLMYFIIFATPFAINLKDTDFKFAISLPTEPFLAGILLLFIIKLLQGNYIDKKIITHPITIAILINTAWLFITCFTSENPLVSFKFFASRLWFIVCFYFLSIQLFKKSQINFKRFMWLYIIAFIGVIFFTIYEHQKYGFDMKSANWVMSPFYNDHTIYGAVLAMYIPVIIGFLFNKNESFTIRFFTGIVLFIFTVATILSYTRAAWISLILAFGLYVVLLFKIKFSTLVIGGLFVLTVGFLIKDNFVRKIEKNKTESSDDFAKHIKSVSNITSDASNLERLNRWYAGFRMFQERPFWGWGPGTYAFYYAPYQLSKDKTIISTNAGDKGNAHSEYIGPLVESGVFGSLSFIGIILTVIYYGINLYKKLPKGDLRRMAMCCFLGLVTYFIHGGLNNFLDTDKAALPFWGFIAVLVSIDVYYKKEDFAKNKAD
ncbi:MAG: O-antigen ligase family protein [Bacteroidota bacterium]